MTSSAPPSLNHAFHPQRGAALVIVLAILVLVVGLVVAFLIMVSSERKAARGYKATVEARQLAETAVNLVQAQIHQATTGLGVTETWASQPGMIRTFQGAGPATGFYKLYSSPRLFLESFSLADAAADVPADWHSRPNEFTDLNAPVVALDRAERYPIVDPSAAGNVKGFEIAGAPAAADGNKAPMPVQWLYVLQKGEVVPHGSDKMSRDNPPVGRIAFWADDDTAKININTASFGNYWDTPRAATTEEMHLAYYQATKNEYQRYPGHPATTSLEPVLGFISGFDAANYDKYYDLAPRISKGGSDHGTQAVAVNGQELPIKQERLYSTIEELTFDPDRNPQALSRADIEKIKFFLTTNSRAPDVTLFNKPRVSMWPLHNIDDSAHRTAYDQLMDFCTTIGGHSFSFRRQDPMSSTTDIDITRNQQLIGYLRTLTQSAVPGFGGSFSGKFGSQERDQILTEIFDYIRCTNILDKSSTASNFQPYAKGEGSNPYYSQVMGQVLPSYDASTDTRGFGRFSTVTEGALVFLGYDDETTAPYDATANPDGVEAGTRRIQAFLLPEMFTPAMGWPMLAADYRIRIRGLSNFLIANTTDSTGSGQTIFPINDGWIRIRRANMEANQFVAGGYDGASTILLTPSNTGRIADNTTPNGGNGRYPFVSDPFDIEIPPSGAPFIDFSGGTLELDIVHPTSDVVLQTVSLEFPEARLPVPEVVAGSPNGTNYRRLNAEGGLNGRFTWVNGWSQADKKRQQAVITDKDVVRSVRAAGTSGGDPRLIAARKTVPSDHFAIDADTYGTGSSASTDRMSHSLVAASTYYYYGASRGLLVDGVHYYSNLGEDPPDTVNSPLTSYGSFGQGMVVRSWDPDVSFENGAVTSEGIAGDWDTGMASIKDGAYINKADEGNVAGLGSGTPNFTNGDGVPYFSGAQQANSYEAPAISYFSPNRMIPSAGMLGSLSTGVKRNLPWQTLQFRPDPENHPGNENPKDHLLLDLFHMPVVEPYAISEPLSTAGRVNMNYQIMPFTYIKRSTGVEAVIWNEKVIAIPKTRSFDYKNPRAAAENGSFRFAIDREETLKAFRKRFDNSDVFRSASEICEIRLVPEGVSGATSDSMSSFWADHALTGDNIKERPYTNLYPRFTTKSNTFTVHFCVQALQPLTQQTDYNPSEDFEVVGESRGSATIERYVDPNDSDLQSIDFATAELSDPNADINSYYRFRTLNWQYFDP